MAEPLGTPREKKKILQFYSLSTSGNMYGTYFLMSNSM